MPEPCRFGYEEYDGARYCFEHAGFLEAGVQSRRCDRARVPADLPGMWERADLGAFTPTE